MTDEESPPPADTAMKFARFKNPNEALGLAVRLVSSVPPFNEMPLGLSVGMLIQLVDRELYGFAVADGRALGFVAWGRTSLENAKGYADGSRQILAEDLTGGTAGVVFAMRSVRPDVTRFLTRRLKTEIFNDAADLFFIRDYGRDENGDRRSRIVRMSRRLRLPRESKALKGQ